MKFPNIANVRFAYRGLWVALSQEALFAFTIVMEMVNGCIERICDFIQPEKDVRIKDIKDLVAGATFFVSLVSLASWFVVIFLHA